MPHIRSLAAAGLSLGIVAGGFAGAAHAQTLPPTTVASSTTTTVAPSTTTPSTTVVATQALTVTPSTVAAGGTTTVSGTCGANTSGFALSSAFVHDATHDFAGVGAAPFTTDGAGHFSVVATVATTTAAGDYPVSARCGGGLLAITATLHVVAAATPVPATPTFTG